MELTLKQFKMLKDLRSNLIDRISSLPDELLIAILSLLPYKDAAAASVVSRGMLRVFCLTTSIDLDDSPITHCLQCPHLIERFTCFKTFVANVLQACLSEHLTRFRLVIGGNKPPWDPYIRHICKEGCLPDLEPELLNAWISFPLSRSVLTELDLFIHVRRPGKLPHAVFACQTLQILKLHTTLDVVTDSPFSLPNLKVLHLTEVVIPEDDFITKLLSGCPVLEDLALDSCLWNHADFVTISSPSLCSLVLNISKRDYHGVINIDIVTIDTPNLRCLRYVDDLACQYRVTQMKDLAKAEIHIVYDLQHGEDCLEASFRSLLSLVRAASSVQHLSLTGASLEVLEEGDLKDQMPVFHNLKYLVLGFDMCKWDKVLFGILNSTPHLETLAFPEGVAANDETEREAEELEREFWERAQPIPVCFRLYLKKVVIDDYVGVQRELKLIKFILRNASVLEQLVVCRKLVKRVAIPGALVELGIEDQGSVKKTLRELPKASIACSIQVQ